MRGFALKKLAAPWIANELAVARSNFSTNSNRLRSAFDLHFFKGIVVEIHVMGARGDFAAIGRIVDDEVGIGAGLNGAFAGEKAEYFLQLERWRYRRSVANRRDRVGHRM